MANANPVGRPATTTSARALKHVAVLSRNFGLTAARAILAADPESELAVAAGRSAVSFPEAVDVTVPTVLNLAKKGGYEPRGRGSRQTRKTIDLTLSATA